MAVPTLIFCLVVLGLNFCTCEQKTKSANKVLPGEKGDVSEQETYSTIQVMVGEKGEVSEQETYSATQVKAEVNGEVSEDKTYSTIEVLAEENGEVNDQETYSAIPVLAEVNGEVSEEETYSTIQDLSEVNGEESGEETHSTIEELTNVNGELIETISGSIDSQFFKRNVSEIRYEKNWMYKGVTGQTTWIGENDGYVQTIISAEDPHNLTIIWSVPAFTEARYKYEIHATSQERGGASSLQTFGFTTSVLVAAVLEGFSRIRLSE